MYDDLAKYFDRLDARAIDPNEMVEIDGRSHRVLDVHKSAQRKRRNKKYRDKNRSAERVRTADWKRAHSDQVKEQKHRVSDRDYHRPFIGVDAEGQDFGGEPVMGGSTGYFMLEGDIEHRGNIYPLHRTILWAAGGWQRLHSSTELASGIGVPTLGKETPWYPLGAPDKRALSSVEIIDWLLDLPAKYDKDHGFPDGVNFGAYAFNYDATQIFADFQRKKVWEITRRRSWKTKKKIKAPVLVGDYAFDYLKSKWLKIWRLRDSDHPKKPKLDKNGNVVLKANGKPKMEIDAIAYICIEDAFGFYQSRFTKAIKPLVSQGYVGKKDYDEIEYMKEHRDEFDQLPFEDIKHYCHRELVCLSKTLTVLRDGFDRTGKPDKPLRVPTWTGAGSPAGALIRMKELKKNHYSPDITVHLENITDQQDHAHLRFIGGRIEPLMQGYAMHRILWLYDIVSAYPSALVQLPSMRDGKWEFHDAFDSQEAAERAALNATILDGFRVKWKFPTWSKKDKRGVPFYPFGY
jgi:hypothetical protein